MMRTFEFSDGKSNKFWKIELQGSSFTVKYGRIGTDGQSQKKEFANEDKAQAAHDKLVAEKLGKGYVETSAGTVSATPSSGKALENAIFANPDDLGAHAAYADFLLEQGDPRGEFIQVQLALEDAKKPAKERKILEKRELELLQKHQDQWLGDLAPFLVAFEEVPSYRVQVQYARGWLDTVIIPQLNVDLCRKLVKLPLARTLRRLEIHNTTYDDEFEEGDDILEDTSCPELCPLLKSNILSNVRYFQLGIPDEECHTNGELAHELVKKMPHLEELHLLAHAVELKALFGNKKLDNLRVLQVYHVSEEYPLAMLAKNSALGKLTHLLIHPHALEPDDEPYINLAGVKALVQSKTLTSLTHLRLRLNDMGDKGVTEIIKSGILQRLKILDIQGGCVTDKGAQALASCADLTNLDQLNISKNMLTREGVAALTKTKVKLEAGDQYKPVPEGQTDDEREYLWEGDIE